MPHQQDSARAWGSNLLPGTQWQHRAHSAILRLSNCAQALAGLDHPRNYIARWSHVRETQLHRIGSNQHFIGCGDVGSLSRGQPADPGMLTSGVRPSSQGPVHLTCDSLEGDYKPSSRMPVSFSRAPGEHAAFST